jgi:hypothetical protein
MSCSNKKCGCAKPEQPREELIDLSALAALGENGAAAVRVLLSVARDGVAGLSRFNLPSGDLYALARTIAALYEERNQLKNVLNVLALGDVVAVETSSAAVQLSFGPGKRYTLIVPVVHEAATIEPTPRTKQLPLPLD